MKAYGSVARAAIGMDSVVGLSTPGPARLTTVGGGASGVAGISCASPEQVDRPRVGEVATGGPQREPLRVLIVDDCTLYRENLARALTENGAEVGVAWDMASFLNEIRQSTPHFVLLNLATRDSAALLEVATNVDAAARVIALGVSEQDEQLIVACAEAGVAGYHTRSESLTELLTLMDKVAAGETHCSPKVSAVLLKKLSTLASGRELDTKRIALTAREAQILEMLKMGLSNRDIADELCIALHTVKNHVHSVLNKLGVRTRAQAVAASQSARPTTARSRT